MELSKLVSKERRNLPPRIVLHGVHGVGKSTWAAGAPSPVFILTEDGLTSIDVPHFPLATTLEQVWTALDLLQKEEHDYKTVVLDTVDWLERLVWAQVCQCHGVKNIEDLGYGKGYTQALLHWERLFKELNKLRESGMAVVVLAHNEVKTYSPPDSDPYDRYQIKLHRHAATMLEEWADLVLFANFKVYVDVDSKKAVGGNDRIIHTTPRPAYRTKSRYALPDTLPMDFTILIKEIKK